MLTSAEQHALEASLAAQEAQDRQDLAAQIALEGRISARAYDLVAAAQAAGQPTAGWSDYLRAAREQLEAEAAKTAPKPAKKSEPSNS